MGQLRHCVAGKCVSDSVKFESPECPSGETVRCAKYESGPGKSKATENIINEGNNGGS